MPRRWYCLPKSYLNSQRNSKASSQNFRAEDSASSVASSEPGPALGLAHGPEPARPGLVVFVVAGFAVAHVVAVGIVVAVVGPVAHLKVVAAVAFVVAVVSDLVAVVVEKEEGVAVLGHQEPAIVLSMDLVAPVGSD